MACKLILFILIITATLLSCKIQSKVIAGKYIDPISGDTLQLNPDYSYEYCEKLNSGYLGWTSGTWTNKKRKLQFKCDSKPLVNYQLNIRIDSATNVLRLKLVQGDKETPIFIEGVKIFKRNAVLNEEVFKKYENVLEIASKDFDSIVVSTYYFKPITFHNTFKANYSFIAKVMPVERLYELDKIPFKIEKSTLKSTLTKEYDNMKYFFTKAKN